MAIMAAETGLRRRTRPSAQHSRTWQPLDTSVQHSDLHAFEADWKLYLNHIDRHISSPWATARLAIPVAVISTVLLMLSLWVIDPFGDTSMGVAAWLSKHYLALAISVAVGIGCAWSIFPTVRPSRRSASARMRRVLDMYNLTCDNSGSLMLQTQDSYAGPNTQSSPGTRRKT